MELEKRNAYFCKSCRKVTITVNVDEGVTPMFISCIYCQKPSTSFMYQVPGCLHIGVQPDLEWYKPSKKEYDALSLGKEEKKYVDDGGLLSRKRTDKPAIKITIKSPPKEIFDEKKN